ncbi:MAG: hypothetical protein MN733_19145 [Nitrososphaera sp.]|nr:hypothetical protein [Nitrososphaera sp.]
MISKPVENPIVAVSVRVYQALLVAYPTKFQQEYGSHMAQVFRDCCLRAFKQSGTYGMFKLWVITFIDLLRSALAERLQKENEMTGSKYIKLSGWAFVIGSFAFITILDGSIAGSVISSILLGIGMLGLRARYGESVGSFGRNILLISIAAMILAYVTTPIFRDNESWFVLQFTGSAVLLIGLSIFGLVALVRKPLPHVNWLPFFAGIGFPAMYFPTLFFAVMNNGASPAWINNYWTIIPIIMSLQFLGLCILGMILQSDAPEEVHAPA